MGAVVSLTLTGCDGPASGETAAPTGHPGGTLILAGQGDVDHLDTAAANDRTTYTLDRAFTRQLVTYPAALDSEHANSIVADLATTVPTRDNGGVSDDGKTYSFTIRDGARWNTNPPRQVTAPDVVRGFKRLCNPATAVRAPEYYATMIAGFEPYCDGLLKVEPTVPAIRQYVDNHAISGIQATGDKTLRITLIRPASDFLNLLALPSSSAAPTEYLDLVPDSSQFRTSTISDGPYQITSYQPGQSIVLDRNPAWDQGSDPVRKAYVDRISVRMGLDSEAVQQHLEAGTADLEWDSSVPLTRIPTLGSDERLTMHDSDSSNPYLVINLHSPNQDGATQKLAVRQALNYAVDKASIGQIFGGPDLNRMLNQVLPPSIDGYQRFNLYPTPTGAGDPAKARQLLTDAGYPNGLTVKLLYRTQGNHPAVAQTLQASLAKAGITVTLIPVSPADFYSTYLSNPDVATQGAWDIAATEWDSDWTGNTARTFFVPLFYGKTYGPGSTNYGGYQNPKTDDCIDRALTEPDHDKAAGIWHDCDRMVMADAAIVPIQSRRVAVFHSSRVHNFIYAPLDHNGDITQVWVR